MFKALINKELSQLLYAYTYDQRKGKPRSKAAAAVLIVVFGFAFLSIAVMFFGMYSMIAENIKGASEPWLLFAMASVVTLGTGIIGSVFSTYAMLYKARDNEFLLSLPIPASMILFVRMLTVYVMNLIPCLIAWLPAIVAYMIRFGFSAKVLAGGLLMLLVLSALVTVITSVLGFLIALVARKLRNTTFVTVLISLVFIGGYYFVYFRMSSIIKAIIANLAAIESAMRGWGYPLMIMGRAALLEPIPLLLSILAAAAVFALLYFVLSRTLFSVLTSSKGAKKAVYHEKNEKRSSVSSALIKRELKRFVSSPTILLNTGLGILFLVAGAILALIKADAVRAFIEGSDIFGMLKQILPAAAYAAACLIASMDCYTASSISIEGKQIWIVQSMPVPASAVLKAKERTHVLLNGIPAAFAAAVLGVILRLTPLEIVLLAAAAFLDVWLCGAFGLMMNVLKPTLNWVNEAVPVKQGIPVLLTLLFGFGICLGLGAVAAGITFFAGAPIALAAVLVIEGLAVFLIDRWLKKKGAVIFSHLV